MPIMPAPQPIPARPSGSSEDAAPLRRSKPVANFYVAVSLMIALLISCIYVGIYQRNRALMMAAIRNQAASYFDLIVRARRWNASYGGVFVEKRAGAETNPYLAQVGAQAEVFAADGRVFTMRNPALMTKEVSRTPGGVNGVTFHITSLRLVNPANAADDFERAALFAFERGAKEHWGIHDSGGTRVFRYMAPLLVETPCLKCHGGLGYRVGDVRGGISVSIPFGPFEGQLRHTRLIIFGLSIGTVGMILAAFYLMLRRLVGKLERAQARLREISTTDELTGLKNRRAALERLDEEFERARRLGETYAVLMLDVDHFKEVNDTHGHPFGDAVLRAVALGIEENLRAYDIASRYGGEEFLVVLPELDLEQARLLAERIIARVAATTVTNGRSQVRVTASVGVAVLEPSDEDGRATIGRADQSLYRAKRGGRNRVEVDSTGQTRAAAGGGVG